MLRQRREHAADRSTAPLDLLLNNADVLGLIASCCTAPALVSLSTVCAALRAGLHAEACARLTIAERGLLLVLGLQSVSSLRSTRSLCRAKHTTPCDADAYMLRHLMTRQAPDATHVLVNLSGQQSSHDAFGGFSHLLPASPTFSHVADGSGGRHIGRTGVGKLCELAALATRPLRALDELSLARQDLCAEAARLLAEALRDGCLPSLSTLRLEVNRIGRAGLRALAAALPCNGAASLRWLSLSQNGIGDAAPLARALALHHTHVCSWSTTSSTTRRRTRLRTRSTAARWRVAAACG